MSVPNVVLSLWRRADPFRAIPIAACGALIYTVFVVSGGRSARTALSGEEYFTVLSAFVSLAAFVLLRFAGRLRLSATDFLVFLFSAWTVANFYIRGGTDSDKLTLFVLLAGLYFSVRILHSFYPGVVRWTVWFVLLSGIVEAVIGLGQAYGLAASHHSLFKVTGTFLNPGPYGGYLAVVFSVALGVTVTRCRTLWPLFAAERMKDWRHRWKDFLTADVLLFTTAVAVLPATAVMLPATMSRSAWIGAAAAIAVGLPLDRGIREKIKNFFKGGSGKIAATLSSFSVALLLFAAGTYHLKKGSADGRLLIWKMTAGIIREHPAGGVGLGYFGGAYADVQAGYFSGGNYTAGEAHAAGNPQYAFNEYLQILAEEGMIGFVLFAGIITLALLCLFRRHVELVPGLVALLVFACSSYPFSLLPPDILLVLLVAFGAERFYVAGAKTSRAVFAVIAFAAMLFAAVTALESGDRYAAHRQWGNVQTLYRMQLYDEVVMDYAALYPWLGGRSEFLFEYGHSLNKTGRYRESNGILEKGTKLNSDPMFYNVMGNNYRALGDTARARQHYMKGFHITPGRIYPLYLLAGMYYEIGDTSRAILYSRRLLATPPKVESPATGDMIRETKEMLKKLNGRNN